VKDTGVGMPPHQLDALFQAFYQGDASTTRKFGGTGLGLSISKQLVELMNGEIKAKSEFGKGSEFIFTVPLELQPDHIQDVVELPDHLKGLCILIVDDCRETRNVLSNIVESFGFHAETAPSGMAAIEMIQSEKHKPFDLILIDFKMPQMHGLETAVTIRSELKMDIPIVLMIDYVDKSVLPESAQMFVNRFLTKPVMGSSLFNLLLEIFGEKTVVEEKPQPYMTESLNGYRKALGGLKVLVAEDNPINQELAIEIFKTIGVEVVIAEDGVKALEALAAQPFDAVLMDIQMPHMDGYETTHKIRENEAFKNLPIIAMTASALPSDEKKCLDAGMNAYVAKPIQLKKLFQVLYENVLSKNSDDFVMLLDSPDIPRIPRRSAEPAPGISSDSIQRLNMDEAMRNLNIDADVYTRIMKTFLLKNQNVMPQIKIWAGLQKWEEIRSHAHSIAGSSSNIGAFHLESAARELETFCREAEINGHADLSRLDWVVGNFDKELNLALAAIDEFLKFSEVKDMPHEISGEELQEKTACLNNLLHALKASDPSKIKASLDHLKKNVDLSTANQIEAKIMDYDYDEAGRMLLKIGLDMGIHLTWDSEK
jgi:CheY-like chemotaxis protein